MPVYLVPFPSHVATYWWKRTTFFYDTNQYLGGRREIYTA